ncbi:MAG TPA: sporulation membrane protein YtaF [Firmicutes bacterium]|nr:sporulation membrane protein YtaF [Bacillota bacterium]
MNTFPILMLALALSIDGFIVGCSYGLKNTKLLPGSLLIIGLITTALMSISMLIGSGFSCIMPKLWGNIIGGTILLLIGIWQLILGFLNYLEKQSYNLETAPLLANIQLESLGIVIKILKAPHTADLDLSGDIDAKEALLLGLALGLDAFVSGFGAGLADFSPLIIPLVALLQTGLIKLGFFVGKLPTKYWLEKGSFFVPGIILVVLGLFKLLKI